MLDEKGKMDEPLQDIGTQESPPILYCRRCGARLEAGVKFCSACGLPVAEDALSGQELKQLSDSAKAAARAGMASARKNVAKGLEAAGGKIASAAEKMSQDKQPDSVSQETEESGNSARVDSASQGKPKKLWKASLGIVAVIAVIFVLMNLFGNDPVKDMKAMKFEEYGPQTLGEAVEAAIPEASWGSVKIDDKHYTVMVSGFCPDLSSNIQVKFDVNYSGDYVYAKTMGVTMDGEYYDDFFSIAVVLGAIYD